MKKLRMAKLLFAFFPLSALAVSGLVLNQPEELLAVDTSIPESICECKPKPGYTGSTMNETCDFHRKANRTGSMFARGYVLYDLHENGHYMVLFHRTPDYGREKYCSEVLDTISIPHSSMPKKLIPIGQQCLYDGKWDPEIFALAPEEAEISGTKNVWRAWRANRSTGKIEVVDKSRVSCPPCIGLFCV